MDDSPLIETLVGGRNTGRLEPGGAVDQAFCAPIGPASEECGLCPDDFAVRNVLAVNVGTEQCDGASKPGNSGSVKFLSRWLPLLQPGQPIVEAASPLDSLARFASGQARFGRLGEAGKKERPPDAMQAIANAAANREPWHSLCTSEDNQGMISDYPDERGA